MRCHCISLSPKKIFRKGHFSVVLDMSFCRNRFESVTRGLILFEFQERTNDIIQGVI